MIRQDSLSKMLIVISMMLTVYLATFETTTLVLFPGILLLIGLVMESYMEKHREFVDHITETSSLKAIGYFTIIALMGMFMSGYMIDRTSMTLLSGFSAISYGVLMAVAEEQFFRGFITDFLVTRFPSYVLALITSACIFTMYHLARYGGRADAMMYVFAGGFILSWVSWKSKRLSPCMLAHAINNVIVLLGVM